MVSVIKRKPLHRVLLIAVATLFWAIVPAADELEAVAGKPEAGDFSLADISGAAHRLSDYRGSVVLVAFWATWCPQCLLEMPSLQTLSNTMPKEEFVILAVNVGEERKVVQTFVERHTITFTILLDHDLATYKKWPVLGIPASFLIDRQGDIVYTVVGAIEWTQPETLSKIKNLIAHSRSLQDHRNLTRSSVVAID